MRRTGFSTIIPSLAPRAEDIALDRLLSPGRHYKHPDDVLRDATLEHGEKRAILSSWASDACAVESMPALRQPPGAERPVPFDSIMDALRRLDQTHPGARDGACAGSNEPHRLDA
ncbi:hypothetical protein FY036_04770 [Mesorhizobium microcysteis]|uniref:Uncharacterized protein n=1 Tax=Neoaquamicrobium microcysteis TaxID=2682781 RepID=A0A5D4H1V8_9HYPH|nr:hypothetical protein [Mesorhizobium microcysteis]TYR34233.1 hypothetical protein FY036_04770 [Mesorhizobium microcysteis]